MSLYINLSTIQIFLSCSPLSTSIIMPSSQGSCQAESGVGKMYMPLPPLLQRLFLILDRWSKPDTRLGPSKEWSPKLVTVSPSKFYSQILHTESKRLFKFYKKLVPIYEEVTNLLFRIVKFQQVTTVVYEKIMASRQPPHK